MPVLRLEPEQVVELVRQMSIAEQRQTLFALAEGVSRREERMTQAEMRLIAAAHQRGQDWLRMSESEREAFVDDWLHEE
jgi:hypothetical protein